LTVNAELVAQVIHLGRTGMAFNVNWSPDGQQVAFLKGYPSEFIEIRERGTTPRQMLVTDLWIAHADGSGPRQLTRCDISQPFDKASYAMSPRWSPDGKTLAYLSGAVLGGQVTLLDVETGQPRNLSYGALPYPIQWSPDSQWLAFSGSDWEAFQARGLALPPGALVRADGQGFRQIGGGEGTAVGEWSPDGTQLLYAPLKPGGGLWVAKMDGSPPRQLGPLSAQAAGLGTWSPDGQWVAYASDPPKPGLWLVNVASLERQQIVPQSVFSVQWSRAGPGIFYLQGQPGKGNLYLLRARDRRKLQFTTSGNLVEAVASPTGKQVAVVVLKEQKQGEDSRCDAYILTLQGEAAKN
jgi:Tol biopolymer transport system component